MTTPAEHAAIVRAVGEWLSQMEGRTVTAADLAAILPDIERAAERATELKRERDEHFVLRSYHDEVVGRTRARAERAETALREADKVRATCRHYSEGSRYVTLVGPSAWAEYDAARAALDGGTAT